MRWVKRNRSPPLRSLCRVLCGCGRRLGPGSSPPDGGLAPCTLASRLPHTIQAFTKYTRFYDFELETSRAGYDSSRHCVKIHSAYSVRLCGNTAVRAPTGKSTVVRRVFFARRGPRTELNILIFLATATITRHTPSRLFVSDAAACCCCSLLRLTARATAALLAGEPQTAANSLVSARIAASSI